MFDWLHTFSAWLQTWATPEMGLWGLFGSAFLSATILPGSSEVVLSAQRGRRWQDETGAQYLLLLDGYRYEGRPGDAAFRIVRFEQHAVRIEAPDIVPSLRKQRARPTTELLGAQEPAAVAELQWRVSMPLSVLLLALLAVPLSRTNPRQGKYARLFVAVLVYLIYSNLLGVSNSWVARGRLAPEIERAFAFAPTRMERYIVACYDSGPGGFFKPHRDNTTNATAHRRFAVTINLNAGEYDGGDLRFPEFGARTYRAPTGGAVVFSCSLLHEATPVTRGKRYAFLPFLYDDAAAAERAKRNQFLDNETIQPYDMDAS